MSRCVCFPSLNQSTSHEKNVPALPKASCPPIRFSGPHPHQGRSRDPRPTPRQGTCPPRGQEYGTQVRAPYLGLGFSSGPTDRSADFEHSPQPTQGLPRARIIRQRRVFDATRNQGRRVSNRHLALNFLPHDPGRPDLATVAFLTPKRLGGAAQRNRLRRRMREIYRRYLAQPAERVYLVWVARPPALELDFSELKNCMAELLKKRSSTPKKSA